jgi:plasmid maintenance system antidote protein VapI
MNASEIMDYTDLVGEIDFVAKCLREEYMDPEHWDLNGMADDLNKAADKLANLVERLRMQ